jgi:hypothetical protein
MVARPARRAGTAAAGRVLDAGGSGIVGSARRPTLELPLASQAACVLEGYARGWSARRRPHRRCHQVPMVETLVTWVMVEQMYEGNTLEMLHHEPPLAATGLWPTPQHPREGTPGCRGSPRHTVARAARSGGCRRGSASTASSSARLASRKPRSNPSSHPAPPPPPTPLAAPPSRRAMERETLAASARFAWVLVSAVTGRTDA